MRIVTLNEETKQDILSNLLKRSPNQYTAYADRVQNILDAVQEKGDEALLEYTAQFDGADLIAAEMKVTEEEIQDVVDIFNSFGKSEIVPESMMDAVTAVSGSSPAYVFMFIEAMADAAVREGMPRAQAYKFAAQSVLGSAKMVLETGKHPGELKDMVCSPGGTTIDAVAKLEERGFRTSVMEAMKARADKSRDMSK